MKKQFNVGDLIQWRAENTIGYICEIKGQLIYLRYLNIINYKNKPFWYTSAELTRIIADPPFKITYYSINLESK
jgi:hypothetical protein